MRSQALDHEGFPGVYTGLLHSLAHALIRQIVLDCGCNSASWFRGNEEGNFWKRESNPVHSDLPTLILATVPFGAKTGKVGVVTPNGSAKSKITFTSTEPNKNRGRFCSGSFWMDVEKSRLHSQSGPGGQRTGVLRQGERYVRT